MLRPENPNPLNRLLAGAHFAVAASSAIYAAFRAEQTESARRGATKLSVALATTRAAANKILPLEMPNTDPEELAKALSQFISAAVALAHACQIFVHAPCGCMPNNPAC